MNSFINSNFYTLILFAAVIDLIIKSFALWHAARAGQRGWFIALLIFNTAGVLPAAYLLYFRPKPS